MQNILVAAILAVVVVGLLVPLFRRDIRTTRQTFTSQKPVSHFSLLLKKLKDYFKND